MAGGISPELYDLEARRKEDGSWHPCRISLSDDGLDIIVHFESNGEKDIISDEKDGLERLRYRSVSIGSGECADVEEGERVLVLHKGRYKSLFFDAVIIEPHRVKHSKRVNCRCLFEIKWLNPEIEENTTTVSLSLIRKLSKKSITSHSAFHAFLNSLNHTTSTNSSPPRSLLDETIWGLVEQIEETNKCTEKSSEWENDKFLKPKRGKLGGDAPSTVTKSANSSRRSTRSQSKPEVKIEVDYSEDKPFISPLAGCAALASYIHESSPNAEKFFSRLEKEISVSPSLDVRKKHSQDHSLEVASILVNPDASNASTVLSSTHNTYYSPENVISLRSSASQSSDSQLSSTRLQISAQESNLSKGKLRSHAIMDNMEIPVPVTDANLRGRTSRITHSSVPKPLIDSTAEVVQKLSKEKHASDINTSRLTRSAEDRVTGNPSIMYNVEISKLVESSQVMESESNMNGHALQDVIQICRNEQTILEYLTTAETDVKPNGHVVTPRTTRSSVQREKLDLTAQVAQESSNKKQNGSFGTTRLTRSSKQKEASGSSTQQELGKRKVTETLRDASVKDLAIAEKRDRKKKSTSSPVDSDPVLTFDMKKRTNSSGITTANGEDQGETSQKTEISKVVTRTSPMVKKKVISSKKPEKRFSPRLRSLPRTRSQKSSPAG